MKKILGLALILFAALSVTALPSCKEKRGELKTIWYNGSYNRDFNDLNDGHALQCLHYEFL